MARIATASERHQLLIRRSISTGELVYYLAYIPEGYVVSLTDLVKVADTRWAMEDDFQDARQAVCLDQTQVRGYRAWKRHTAVALAAYALLAIASALAKAAHPAPVLPDDADQAAPADCGKTALTVPEIQRLLATTVTQEYRRCRTSTSIWPGPTGEEPTRPELAGTTTAHASRSRHDRAYQSTRLG